MKPDVTFVTLGYAFWMAFPHKRFHFDWDQWNIRGLVTRMVLHGLEPYELVNNRRIR